HPSDRNLSILADGKVGRVLGIYGPRSGRERLVRSAADIYAGPAWGLAGCPRADSAIPVMFPGTGCTSRFPAGDAANSWGGAPEPAMSEAWQAHRGSSGRRRCRDGTGR